MPSLSLSDIDELVMAYGSLLEPAEALALREALVMRSAEPDATLKLRLSVFSLLETQRQNAEAFVMASQTVTAGIVERGRAALEAITDDEWETVLNGD